MEAIVAGCRMTQTVIRSKQLVRTHGKNATRRQMRLMHQIEPQRIGAAMSIAVRGGELCTQVANDDLVSVHNLL